MKLFYSSMLSFEVNEFLSNLKECETTRVPPLVGERGLNGRSVEIHRFNSSVGLAAVAVSYCVERTAGPGWTWLAVSREPPVPSGTP